MRELQSVKGYMRMASDSSVRVAYAHNAIQRVNKRALQVQIACKYIFQPH